MSAPFNPADAAARLELLALEKAAHLPWDLNTFEDERGERAELLETCEDDPPLATFDNFHAHQVATFAWEAAHAIRPLVEYVGRLEVRADFEATLRRDAVLRCEAAIELHQRAEAERDTALRENEELRAALAQQQERADAAERDRDHRAGQVEAAMSWARAICERLRFGAVEFTPENQRDAVAFIELHSEVLSRWASKDGAQ